MRLALTVAAALLLAACTSDGDASTPTGTVEATPPPTATLEAIPALTATPTPPPSFEELYDPRPYRPVGERTTPSPITRIPPPSIEAAETEGPRWLGEHAYDGPLPAVFAGVEGSSEPRCVEVGTASRVRSNDWVLDISQWSAPEHVFELFPANPEASHAYLIRATRLDGDLVATHVYEQWSGRREGELGVSYRASLVLPHEGQWLAVVTAGAQWGCFLLDVPEPPPEYRIGASVAEIEELGTEFPSIPPPEELPVVGFHQWSVVRGEERFTPVDGTAERRCVEAPHTQRSGEWTFGPNYSQQWGPELPGTKVGFGPLHQPEDLRTLDYPLRVTATFLDDPRHTYTYVETGNIYSLDPETNAPIYAGFATEFVLPRAGDWAIVATSGPNWGCFLVSLSEPDP